MSGCALPRTPPNRVVACVHLAVHDLVVDGDLGGAADLLGAAEVADVVRHRLEDREAVGRDARLVPEVLEGLLVLGQEIVGVLEAAAEGNAEALVARVAADKACEGGSAGRGSAHRSYK